MATPTKRKALKRPRRSRKSKGNSARAPWDLHGKTGLAYRWKSDDRGNEGGSGLHARRQILATPQRPEKYLDLSYLNEALKQIPAK
jgi:hypothetical protein